MAKVHKPNYVVVPAAFGRWMVTDLNGSGRVHGIDVVADSFETKAEAEAWIAKAAQS